MNVSSPFPVTDEEIATAKTILKKLEPGFLPLDIFLEAARLVTLSVIEIVPLRLHGSTIEVLLTKRSPNDLFFPNMLHTPGTIVRPTDKEGSDVSAFHRILSDELASVTIANSPSYVMTLLHKSKRGMENARIFFVEVTTEPTVGSFYDVENLPNTTVSSQINFITAAVQSFRLNKLGKT